MAILHNLAGQYGKNEARKITQRTFLLLVLALSMGLSATSFASGYSWSRWGPEFGLIAMLLVAGPVIYTWRWIARNFDAGVKDRIKYMRGGQSEAYVAWLLKEYLEDEWHVFNNIKLESESDTDHVVVGPSGVFCISTKSQRGWFVGTPDGLLHNQRPSGFAKDALRQAKNLAERLKSAMGADVPWVQAVLALPFGYIDNDGCGGKVWIAHAENLADRIAPENGPRKLRPAQVARIVKVMEMIAASAAEIYRRPNVTKPTPAPLGGSVLSAPTDRAADRK